MRRVADAGLIEQQPDEVGLTEAHVTDTPDEPRIDTAVRLIAAPPETVYAAWMDPAAVAKWLPPAGMACRIDAFDPRPGGTFRMLLTYLAPEHADIGKSGGNEDAVEGTFVALEPGRRIVQDIVFRSGDPAFAGTMRMTWLFTPVDAGTTVTIRCENVPAGIRPEDHAAGLSSTLDGLAAHLE